MVQRNASSAIYVAKNPGGLAKEIGDWGVGSQWVACTHELMMIAIRFLIIEEHLRQKRSASPTVDTHSIEAQVQSVRTSLVKIKNIKTKVSNVHKTADEIADEADALRIEVNEALFEIETALKTTRPTVSTNGHFDERPVA